MCCILHTTQGSHSLTLDPLGYVVKSVILDGIHHLEAPLIPFYRGLYFPLSEESLIEGMLPHRVKTRPHEPSNHDRSLNLNIKLHWNGTFLLSGLSEVKSTPRTCPFHSQKTYNCRRTSNHNAAWSRVKGSLFLSSELTSSLTDLLSFLSSLDLGMIGYEHISYDVFNK